MNVNQDEQKQLRRVYQILRAQQRAIDHDPKAFMVTQPTVDLIQEAVARLKANFPELVPRLDLRSAHSHEEFFNIEPVRSYVATLIGTIEAELEADEGPVIESRVFLFIRDKKIRDIVERDYQEIQRAFVAQCWKSAIILAGGAIEAILTDALLAQQTAATSAKNAPGKSDITKWDLADLIDVAVELGVATAAVAKLSHPVREYRNLVHPGNEMRTGLTFDREEARIALEVLNILHRDLS